MSTISSDRIGIETYPDDLIIGTRHFRNVTQPRGLTPDLNNQFQTIEQRFDRHVVIPDLHGEAQLATKTIEKYVSEDDIGFVFLGDIIDRKGVKNDPEQGVRKTIDILKQLGDRAILTVANHEIYLLGSVLSGVKEQRQLFRNAWLGRLTTSNGGNSSIEQNTLSSYDITNDGLSAVDRLWREMRVHQHDKVLINATPYYETDSFFAVHAGLRRNQDFDEQKEDLERSALDMSKGIYIDTPDQWFSIELAIDARPNQITDKTVVSGHAHYLNPNGRYKKMVHDFSSDRVLHDGRRVRLASQVNSPQNDALFVWQDWDGCVVRIER